MSKRAAFALGLRWLGSLAVSIACQSGTQQTLPPAPSAAPATAPHTALDFEPAPPAPAKPPTLAPDPAAPPSGASSTASSAPRLAATSLVTPVYVRPDASAKTLGYLRLGAVLERAPEPVLGGACAGAWYPVLPQGFVCTDQASLDIEAPLVRAARRRPALDRPLPYRYGFLRDDSPEYRRIPSRAEQHRSEPELDARLAGFSEQRSRVQRVSFGANDAALDARGYPAPGLPLPPERRLSTQLEPNELFGGAAGQGVVPFWAQAGLPGSASSETAAEVYAGRLPAKTGVSFVDAFVIEQEGVERGFAVTPELRLLPIDALQPGSGSGQHGVELTGELALPFAFIEGRSASAWQLLRGQDEARRAAAVPYRALVPMSGDVRIKAGARYYQTQRDRTSWLRADDVALVAAPPALPAEAERGEKWIDVSLAQQTLVLYRGAVAEYAALISSSKARAGAPASSNTTPLGVFRIRSKHITAHMDSEEESSVPGGQRTRAPTALSAKDQAVTLRLLAAEKAGKRLSPADQKRLANVKQGRRPDPATPRRAGAYLLEDAPWVQYFEPGYALLGAYWHDDFGTPRTRGNIELSPVDAFVLFAWTTPSVPGGWHGVDADDENAAGTLVRIRE